MMFDSYRSYYPNFIGEFSMAGGAVVVCLILAIIGGLVLLLAFLPEHKEHKYSGFALWLYRLLNFRKMFSMSLLKLLYIISAIFITLMGIVILLFARFFAGLLYMVFGNLIIRIVYEFMILVFSIHDNLTQINKNTAQLVNNTQEKTTGQDGQQ